MCEEWKETWNGIENWSLFKKQHRYFIIYAMPCLSSTAWMVFTLIEGILLFAYA